MFYGHANKAQVLLLLLIGRNIAEESEHVSIFSHEKIKNRTKIGLKRIFNLELLRFFFLNDTLIIFFLC